MTTDWALQVASTPAREGAELLLQFLALSDARRRRPSNQPSRPHTRVPFNEAGLVPTCPRRDGWCGESEQRQTQFRRVAPFTNEPMVVTVDERAEREWREESLLQKAPAVQVGMLVVRILPKRAVSDEMKPLTGKLHRVQYTCRPLHLLRRDLVGLEEVDVSAPERDEDVVSDGAH